MTELSIIIPSVKPRREIEVLDYLEASDFSRFEVIIRDDPSATAARNEGVRRANSEKLVFLDDDSKPRLDYLERAAALLDREAVVAGRTVHPRDDVFSERIASHYDFGDDPRYITRFWGCNACLRKEVLDTVGMWDEAMPWGHEEKELAERILREYPIYYDPELVVYHSYADSLVDYWKKQYRLEKQTPYYWDKTGVDQRQQWLNVVQYACNPVNYAGLSPRHTAARAGAAVAVTLGRIRGMF